MLIFTPNLRGLVRTKRRSKSVNSTCGHYPPSLGAGKGLGGIQAVHGTCPAGDLKLRQVTTLNFRSQLTQPEAYKCTNITPLECRVRERCDICGMAWLCIGARGLQGAARRESGVAKGGGHGQDGR